ncbi:MAG: cytochrome d ubiquinol oxidase subunit II [Syntrophobacterales bacterium]|jgi:cytochrome d ubiquinol oxidase subunit II|nr:cytochrome d ubiquinol oxidase subunit II [Syntrophobacterales bacterium]
MLETTWFVLWGVLWALYFMLDGFDIGVGMLSSFVARDEKELRAVYRSIGPFWDGNEVWLITAGGVTFAAFPAAYAVLFSAFYSPLMLILFGLIMRGVSLELRGKVESDLSRRFWDVCLVFGSFIPALLFGVAFANIFKGIPIDNEGLFHGGMVTILHPYGLAGGFLFVALFLMHGALWLSIKVHGNVGLRAEGVAQKMWYVVLFFAIGFLALSFKETSLFGNYVKSPALFVILLVTLCALFGAKIYMYKGIWWKAWWGSAVTIMGTTLFGVVGLYPSLLPSSLDRSYSLTIYNASSSPLTLKIMLAVALIFVPVVLLYQIWAYRVFRGKISEESLDYENRY